MARYPVINPPDVTVGSSSVLVCGSVPDEGSASEDRIAPPSPEDRDSGLFMLKKDSERRAILFKVLNEDQAKVISNLRENYIQVCFVTPTPETHLTSDGQHFSQVSPT